MKANTLLLFLLFFFGIAKISAISDNQAREILQSRFVSLVEAKSLYPDIPDTLEIPFTTSTLQKNKGAWLIPVKINSKFEYLLIRANFENEICMLKDIDTLDLKTSKEVLTIIKKVRPWFPDRSEAGVPFKYFFRTEEGYVSKKSNYKKAISYDGKNFIVVDLPNDLELGVINKEYISYLTKNKNGVEIQFETTPLPENHPKVNDQQSILILTLFSCRE